MKKTEQENPFGYDPEMDSVREERTQWLDPIVVVSGGFDPVHKGHVELFKNAAKHGKVHVLLNSDDWLSRKKGCSFLPFETRQIVLNNMVSIHRVHAVDDKDETVSQGLAELRKKYPHTKIYFANGGDRKLSNTPEMTMCECLKIEMLWNVGGEKIDSSSELLSNYEHRHGVRHLTSRDWGTYEILGSAETFIVKELIVWPRRSISFQRHHYRLEEWLILEGEGIFVLDEKNFNIKAKDRIQVLPMAWHWVKNTSHDNHLRILETWFGEVLEESDIEREEFDETIISK
tara:strand:- start:16012 stop:16875 length:864 start_codon:yes stop_codon:yes gene_type:complete